MFLTPESTSSALSRRAFAPLVAALLLLGAFALTGCGDDDDPMSPPPPPTNTGFDDEYVVENWGQSGITGGSTDVVLVADTGMEEARFTYAVNLGNPANGVSERMARFGIEAMASGSVTIDWTYTGYHAFFEAYADLIFFASQGEGTEATRIVEVDSEKVSGNFSFSGSTTFEVVEGELFGLEIGGENFDSDSRLNGTLQIDRLVAPR